MSVRKLILMLIVMLILFSTLGYFARPWVDGLIPGRVAKKMMPELDGIYGRSVRLKNTIRNPVIVIPGMMGSKLTEAATGRSVWGVFDGQSIDPSNADDVRLLACPIQGDDLDRFDDGVLAAGVLDTLKIEVASITLNQQAYLNILRMLGVGGYRDEELGLAGEVNYGSQHFTCFQFPYDWRRDNAENARRLDEFIKEKKEYIQAERKTRFGIDEPVKFDIVAHSMGSLVARYYLRHGAQGPMLNGERPTLDWSGCESVERVVLIGPPNNGATKSLVSIHEGFSFSVLFDSFPSGLVATLPAIYQLLPNGPGPSVFDAASDDPIDLYDVENWDRRNWGMLNPDQDGVLQQLLPEVESAAERRAIAKSHVQRCLVRAKAFHEALNVPAQPPAGTTIYMFAGDALPTVETVSSDLLNRTLTVRSVSPGDNTVTRNSALADRRTEANWTPALQTPVHFSEVRFMFDDHFGLTRDAEFTDNALYLLLEDPSKTTPARIAVPLE